MPVAFERLGLLYRPQTLAVAAGFVVFTALAIVVGFFLRLSRNMQEKRGQRIARLVQLASAVLWLIGIVTFGVWISGVMADLTVVFRDWPGPLLLLASSSGLAASALTLSGALLLPQVWRHAPDSADWTIWRKSRYTAALAVFGAFGGLLGAWGALEPWAS
jgi:hypothetical protein